MRVRRRNVRALVGTMIVLIATLLVASCNSTPAGHEPDSTSPTSSTANSNNLPSLAGAMGKLQHAIEKPDSPFHLSFKKLRSDGDSSQCEADVSSDGITGQQTNMSPARKIGDEAFPASTQVRTLAGKPPGSLAWGIVRTNLLMAYMSEQIGDAQQGLKYVGEEQTGGYNSRRYDFDLTNISSDAKKALILTNAFGGGRQLKDYNVKGSAWLSKDDDRMVKFEYDAIMLFNDGENDTTHYEGIVTKK
jgi:hypothetical protein